MLGCEIPGFWGVRVLPEDFEDAESRDFEGFGSLRNTGGEESRDFGGFGSSPEDFKDAESRDFGGFGSPRDAGMEVPEDPGKS